MLLQPLVSVITPTTACDRGSLIRRAIDSVRRQDYPCLEHIIVGDQCAANALTPLAEEQPHGVPLRAFNAPCPVSDIATYRPARAAHARMAGVRAARGSLLAFLDDDNEYEPGHVAAMVQAIQGRPHVPAVYSWRQLVHPDGSPYLTPASPWEGDPLRARRDYDDLVAAGVWVPGTNLLQDSLATNTVDSSCWLLRRELLTRVPFRITYRGQERTARLGEDVAFCFDLQRYAIPVRQVPQHSVRYYLGGFSTSGNRDYTGSALVPQVASREKMGECSGCQAGPH
jgi:glycosyltransferase involved in cell wall biosynthesis